MHFLYERDLVKVDRYEYNVKSDQIKKFYSEKDFESAAEIADEIDWYKVKDKAMLNKVADIYENIRQYDKAKEILLIAYERSPLGRQLAYKLTILALRTKNYVEADEFYQDFVEMAPTDVTQYLLKYRIAKAKGEHIDVLLRILEAYVEVEMDERWQYELAKLYHEAGRDDDCVKMCKELELWFNEGKYVNKAKELKKLITGGEQDYSDGYSYDNDQEYQDNSVSNHNYSFNYDLKAMQENEYNDNSESFDQEEYQNEGDESQDEQDLYEQEELVSNALSDDDSESAPSDEYASVEDIEETYEEDDNDAEYEEEEEYSEADREDNIGDENYSEVKSLAESIVQTQEENDMYNQEYSDGYDREENEYEEDADDEIAAEDMGEKGISEKYGEIYGKAQVAENRIKSEINSGRSQKGSKYTPVHHSLGGEKYYKGNRGTDEQIRTAQEALKIAMDAAVEAQRAADIAKRLVEEAMLNVNIIKGIPVSRDALTGGKLSTGIYAGMTIDELRKQLDEEEFKAKEIGEREVNIPETEAEEDYSQPDDESGDEIKGVNEAEDGNIMVENREITAEKNTEADSSSKESDEASDDTTQEKEIDSDSKIEIFEFDKSKEGKGRNIGDELTKTAEIDISEINFRLETDNALYNTANIQEALAQSMAALMGETAAGVNVKKPTLSKSETAKEYIDEASKKLNGEQEKEEKETEAGQEATEESKGNAAKEEEDGSSDVLKQNQEIDEKEINEELLQERLKEYYDKQPTKVIDQKEINRILKATQLKNVYETVPLSPLLAQGDTEDTQKQEEVFANVNEENEAEIETPEIKEGEADKQEETPAEAEKPEIKEEEAEKQEETPAEAEKPEIKEEEAEKQEETPAEAEKPEIKEEEAEKQEETPAEATNTITNIADMNEISHQDATEIAKEQESILEDNQAVQPVEKVEPVWKESQSGIRQTESVEEPQSDIQTAEGKPEETQESLIKTEPKPEEAQESLWKTEAKPEEAQESLWKTETKPEEAQESLWKTEAKPEEAQESLWKTEAKPEEAQESLWKTETKPEEAQESLWKTEAKPEEAQESLWKTETKPEEAQESLWKTEPKPEEQELSAGAMSATDLAREVMAALDMGGIEEKAEESGGVSNKMEPVQPVQSVQPVQLQEEPPQIVDASEVKGEERLKINSQPNKNQNVEMAELVEAGEEEKKDPDAYVSVGHRIPENYKDMFKDFASTDTMERGIADTLNNLINNFVMDGSSQTNNLIVTGNAKSGKTTLGLSIIKASNRGRKRSKRRVAKVKATVLNKRGVAPAMTQIIGTDLIIEQAGNLMPNTIKDLMAAMKGYTEEMLIVLEDDKAAIDRMLDNNPELLSYFNNRLDIEELEINDMVKIAKEYAATRFYEIDAMGELALSARLNDISGTNPLMSIEDIQEVIDEAIEHEKKFSFGKIFGKMKKGKGEMSVLTEQDFQ